MDELRIILPIPHRSLHPNGRPHWAAKSAATRNARSLAKTRAQEVIRGDGFVRPLPQPPRWERANAQVTFYAPDRRRRDADGILASLKAAFDGLADAEVVVNDSGFIHYPVLMEYDAQKPRVEVRIWPA